MFFAFRKALGPLGMTDTFKHPSPNLAVDTTAGHWGKGSHGTWRHDVPAKNTGCLDEHPDGWLHGTDHPLFDLSVLRTQTQLSTAQIRWFCWICCTTHVFWRLGLMLVLNPDVHRTASQFMLHSQTCEDAQPRPFWRKDATHNATTLHSNGCAAHDPWDGFENSANSHGVSSSYTGDFPSPSCFYDTTLRCPNDPHSSSSASNTWSTWKFHANSASDSIESTTFGGHGVGGSANSANNPRYKIWFGVGLSASNTRHQIWFGVGLSASNTRH